MRIAGQMIMMMLSELQAPLSDSTSICCGTEPKPSSAMAISMATTTMAALPTLHFSLTRKKMSSSTGTAASRHRIIWFS